MPRTFVDLSIYLENDVLSDPPPFAPQIEYFTHEHTVEQIQPFFPGLQKADLPDGEGWAVEKVQLSTHNGTHLDAPWHFHSTQDAKNGGSRPSITIDQVPLEWCFQSGVKLVEVTLDGWDTHKDGFERVKKLSSTLDPAMAALVVAPETTTMSTLPRALSISTSVSCGAPPMICTGALI